jgi:hypothetical protein
MFFYTVFSKEISAKLALTINRENECSGYIVYETEG